MNDNGVEDFFAFIFFVVLAFGCGLFLAKEDESGRQEWAVEQGKGEYYWDENLEKAFRWKTGNLQFEIDDYAGWRLWTGVGIQGRPDLFLGRGEAALLRVYLRSDLSEIDYVLAHIDGEWRRVDGRAIPDPSGG